MPDIIHVDMDCFYAAVEVKDNPDLAGKPVIVGALPGTRGVVSACNYEARAYGVHSAMPVSQAYRKCPGGVFLFPRGWRYVEESTRIHDIFHRFTPLVEPLSLDEAFLDVSGSHLLFGTSEHIGREIKRIIRKETGLVASVGIAPSKFIAKIASDIRKPDGFVIVHDDEALDFLAPLDVRKIWGVGQATAKILDKLGLRTVADIRAYPAGELERLLGRSGRHLYDLANGIDDRTVNPGWESRQAGAEHTFETDTADTAEVERTLLALCDKVASRLFRKSLRGKTITLKLRDETFKTITRSRTLPRGIMAGEEIYRESRALLRKENLGGRRVRLIGVSVSSFEDDPQMPLFDESSAARTDKVEEVIAAVRGRFGKDAIVRASLATAKEPPEDGAPLPKKTRRHSKIK